MMNLRQKNPYLLGIDIGTSTVKIAGMHLGQNPSVSFSSITDLPAGCDDAYIADAIKKAVGSHRGYSKEAVLTFSDESFYFRRIEIAGVPHKEILDALKWKAKDSVPFDIQKSIVDYKVLGESQKEDGSKAMEILFVAVPTDAVERKINIVKDAGLDVVAANVIPFGVENLLKIDQRMGGSKTMLIADFGYSKTDVSIYKNNSLQFTRSIPIGSGNISTALEGAILTDGGEVSLSKEEAEATKRNIGISYENVRLTKGIGSRQALSLMRPVLEQFVKEIRRSIDYYIQEFGEDSSVEAFLIGGGSKLKNLDKFLSEELGIPVASMSLPDAVDISAAALNKDDLVSIIGLIGAMLGYKSKPNLLPAEYKTERVETIEKISLRMMSLALAIILLVSFAFTKIRIYDYSHRLMNVRMQQSVLGEIKNLQDSVAEREALLNRVQAGEISVEHVMRGLSNLIPTNVVLTSLIIDQRSRTLDMKGIAHMPAEEVQGVLTKFMEDMERSGHCKDAQLSSLQSAGDSAGSTSTFEIISSLELEQ